jgi:hypothetical protein
MEQIAEKDGYLRLLIMSTTLMGTYNEWINNPHVSEVLDVNTNATCLELKKVFPSIDNKVSQSIALGILMYFYFIFCATLTSNDAVVTNDYLDLD